MPGGSEIAIPGAETAMSGADTSIDGPENEIDGKSLPTEMRGEDVTLTFGAGEGERTSIAGAALTAMAGGLGGPLTAICGAACGGFGRPRRPLRERGRAGSGGASSRSRFSPTIGVAKSRSSSESIRERE